MLNFLECPKCKTQLKIQTNKAILIRKDVMKLLTAHVEKSAHYKKMSESYKKEILKQLYRESVKDMLIDYTRKIEAQNVD